jgi:3-oxoacyl-[acyl-carrier-protein] synthase III
MSHRCTIAAHALRCGPAPHSSVELASGAALDCLEQAGLEPDEVDLLVSTGVYRDKNISEPAMAALIQKRVGINRDPSKFPVASTAFSFDLMNSAVGLLNALQVVDALVRVGQVGTALVVAGDVHPSQQVHPDFPFRHAGGAFLLRRAAPGSASFEAHASGSSDIGSHGRWGYCDLGASGPDSRRAIVVEQDADALEQLERLAIEGAQRFHSQHARAGERLLVLPSALSAGFAGHLARGLGVVPDQVVDSYAALGDTHSAAPIAAWDLAGPARDQHDALLFVAAGAGPCFGFALYR